MAFRTSGKLLVMASLFVLNSPAAAEFVHPGKADDPLIYGVKNGIVVAVHPFGFDRGVQGGPRGLLRVGYEQDGKYYHFNLAPDF